LHLNKQALDITVKSEIMREIDMVCSDCKHYARYNKTDNGCCLAFDRIPYGFLIGEHKKPFRNAPNPTIEGEFVTQEGDYVFEWVCGDCAILTGIILKFALAVAWRIQMDLKA
jgi:hypothetical protein